MKTRDDVINAIDEIIESMERTVEKNTKRGRANQLCLVTEDDFDDLSDALEVENFDLAIEICNRILKKFRKEVK